MKVKKGRFFTGKCATLLDFYKILEIEKTKMYTAMSTKLGEKAVKIKEKDKDSLEAYTYEKVES